MVERWSYVFLGSLALGVGCGGASTPGGGGAGGPGSGTGGAISSGGGAGSTGQGGSTTGSGGAGVSGDGGAGGSGGSSGGKAGGGSAGASPGGSGGGFSVTFPGTGLNDQLHDVAVDSLGRAVVVGGVDGAFAIGSNDSDGGVLVLRLDQEGNVDWGAVYGSVTGTSLTDFDTRGEGVAIGSDDSFVVVGSYRSDVYFDGKELSVVDSQQGPDAFVAKCDANGEVLWAYGYGSPGYDSANDVALDAQGNVYVTGYVTGTVDFGGGDRATTTQSPFVLKLDGNGNHQYSKVYPGSGNASAGAGIGVDSTGAAWVGGYFAGTVDFGGDEITRMGDEYGAFLLGLSTSGEHVFSSAYGDSGYHYGFGLLVQPDGSVLMTGTAVGEIDFGGGTLGAEYSAESLGALYAAHFGPGAAYDWAEFASGTGDYDGYGVAADALGNYYVAGEVLRSGSFDTAPVLVKFDATGNEIDQRVFEADGRFDAVAVEQSGNVYAVGWFYSSADFGFGELTGENDIAIVKLPKE